MLRFGDTRLPARFWDKVEKRDSGCWIWFGGYSQGYGTAYVNGQRHDCSRLAFTVERSILPGHFLRHQCGDRRCVNPRHLVPQERKSRAAKESAQRR